MNLLKLRSKRSIIRVLFFSALLICLTCRCRAWAVVREGAVPGREGLAFHDLTYRFDSIQVTITNKNGHNVIFGGTMVFLDRHYRPVARAELLPQHIKRRSSRKYRAVFTEGSGHEAKAASFLVWEFDQRNN